MTNNHLFYAHIPWIKLNPTEFTWIPCLLCGDPNYKPVASFTVNWTEFWIVECPGCGLRWRNPIPDTRFLMELYSDQYYNVEAHAPEWVYQVGIADTTTQDQDKRRAITQREVQRWQEEYNITPDNSSILLEIGGGRGYLQQAAQEAGWQTLGLEISPHGIRAGIEKGLHMIPVPLDIFCTQYISHPGQFDVIAAFDFLEHVTDPGQVLRMIRYTLKDSGVLILRVPLTREYPRLHLIDHIWYFTPRTINQLLKKEGFMLDIWQPSGVFCGPNGGKLNNVTLFVKKKEIT